MGRYAKVVLKGRWLEAEQLLIKNAPCKRLVHYASKVIGGRWPEAESRLIREAPLDLLCDYLEVCVKTRWPEVESRLLAEEDSSDLVDYAAAYVRSDWPDLAWKLIREAPEGSLNLLYRYAVEVLGGRWREGEKIILSPDSYVAVAYTRDFLKRRVPKLEKRMWHVRLILDYAREIIKGRWPEREACILSKGSPEQIRAYAKKVIGGRWPEAEEEIRRRGSADDVIAYAIEVIGGPWPEVEAAVFSKTLDIRKLVEYATDAIRGRWLIAESRILQQGTAQGDCTIGQGPTRTLSR
jgi:hypothetical protein